jgi:sugar lactone lactonase YvrE
VVTTLAGNGTPGFADGPAGSAELDGPEALVVDGAGDVYFTDQANNRIREVDARGMVSTLAGNGDAGYVDGPGGSAEFDAPDGIALNAMGDLFIGDFDDSCIREVDPSGDVTTYSGNGMAGFANGPVASAEFNRPEGVAIDRLGNLYVADDHNFRIREIGTDGVVTTLAGNGTKGYVDGPAASAEFGNSNGLAVDSNFNVYVTDSTNNRIRMIDTATGLVSTLAGNGQSGSVDGPGGPNGSAELDYPLGVAVDSNFNVYVADAVNNRIRRIDPNGNVTTLAGNGVAGFQDGSGGEAGTAELDYPTGVALDGLGNLYVTDSKNNRIRLIVTSPPYGAGIPPG